MNRAEYRQTVIRWTIVVALAAAAFLLICGALGPDLSGAGKPSPGVLGWVLVVVLLAVLVVVPLWIQRKLRRRGKRGSKLRASTLVGAWSLVLLVVATLLAGPRPGLLVDGLAWLTGSARGLDAATARSRVACAILGQMQLLVGAGPDLKRLPGCVTSRTALELGLELHGLQTLMLAAARDEQGARLQADVTRLRKRYGITASARRDGDLLTRLEPRGRELLRETLVIQRALARRARSDHGGRGVEEMLKMSRPRVEALARRATFRSVGRGRWAVELPEVGAVPLDPMEIRLEGGEPRVHIEKGRKKKQQNKKKSKAAS
jgi:hypothetical protein